MNERIQELAKQAGAYFGGGTTDYFGDYLPPYMSITDVDLEKFAELIVAECIAVHEDDYGVDIIGDVLKKHFGVEE